MKDSKGGNMPTDSIKRKYFKDMIEMKTNKVYGFTKTSDNTTYGSSTVCESNTNSEGIETMPNEVYGIRTDEIETVTTTDATQVYETIN